MRSVQYFIGKWQLQYHNLKKFWKALKIVSRCFCSYQSYDAKIETLFHCVLPSRAQDNLWSQNSYSEYSLWYFLFLLIHKTKYCFSFTALHENFKFDLGSTYVLFSQILEDIIPADIIILELSILLQPFTLHRISFLPVVYVIPVSWREPMLHCPRQNNWNCHSYVEFQLHLLSCFMTKNSMNCTYSALNFATLLWDTSHPSN